MTQISTPPPPGESAATGVQSTSAPSPDLEHLVAGIPTAFEHATTHLEELQHTIAQARRLHGHPFTFAAELASARLRYADLTRQLTEQTNQTPGMGSGCTAGRQTNH